MSPKKHSLKTRFTALVLVLLFSWNTAAMSAPLESVSSSIKVTGAEQLFKNFEIPKEWGSVEETYFPPQFSSQSPVIIHIRDAHSQPEAQRHIEEILHFLSSQKQINAVAVEAGFGKTDASILNLLPDADANKAVAETLLDMGELGGEGLFAANFPASANIYGVEDRALYKNSLDIFKNLKFSKTELNTLIQSYQTSLEESEARVFPPELKNYIIKKRAWENHRDVSADYFLLLSTLAKKYLKLDLTDARNQAEWPYLIRLLKAGELEHELNLEAARKEALQLAGQIASFQSGHAGYLSSGLQALGEINKPFETWMEQNPYQGSFSSRHFFELLWQEAKNQKISMIAYPHFLKLGGLTILRQEIEPELLFKEAERIEESIEAEIALTAEQKRVLEAGKDLALISKLLSLQMSREDYKSFLQIKDRLTPENIQKTFQTFSKEEIQPGLFSESHLKDAENFYALSLKRDESLIENTLQFAGSKPAVLIAGGFHSEGLTRILKEKNIPFISITPKMTQVEDGTLYERAMMGDNADLKYLLASPSVLRVLQLISSPEIYAEYAGPEKQRALLLHALLTSGVQELQRKKWPAEKIYAALQKALAAHPQVFGDVRIFLHQNVPIQLATGKKSADLIRLQIPSLGFDKTFTITSNGLTEAKPAIRLLEPQVARSETRGSDITLEELGKVFDEPLNFSFKGDDFTAKANRYDIEVKGFLPDAVNPESFTIDLKVRKEDKENLYGPASQIQPDNPARVYGAFADALSTRLTARFPQYKNSGFHAVMLGEVYSVTLLFSRSEMRGLTRRAFIRAGAFGFLAIDTFAGNLFAQPKGRTFYVSPSGADNAAGAADKPFKTINFAVTQLKAGDTLIIKEGNYDEAVDIKVSGKAGAPITIKGEGKVVFDGAGKTNGAKMADKIKNVAGLEDVVKLLGDKPDFFTKPAFNINGQSYIRIENITVNRMLA